MLERALANPDRVDKKDRRDDPDWKVVLMVGASLRERWGSSEWMGITMGLPGNLRQIPDGLGRF